MVPEVFPEETHMNHVGYAADAERYCFMMSASHEHGVGASCGSESIFAFFRQDDFLTFLRGTGGQERGGYALRTYLYSRAAWKTNLAFMPDYPRVPFLESLLDEVHRSVVSEGYEVLAERLRYEAQDFLADARPVGLPLPPFMSILLSRCNSVRDIVPRLLEMREEFEVLRTNLTNLEETRLSAATIKDRNESRLRVEAIFKSVAKAFDKTGYATFKSVVDYAGDASSVALDWSNPASYKSSLVTQPLDWIKAWWLRRPFAQLFDIGQEFRRIEDYNKLVQRVFNAEVDQQDIRRFELAVMHLSSLFRGRKLDA
jgi:hypothetical protein